MQAMHGGEYICNFEMGAKVDGIINAVLKSVKSVSYTHLVSWISLHETANGTPLNWHRSFRVSTPAV